MPPQEVRCLHLFQGQAEGGLLGVGQPRGGQRPPAPSLCHPDQFCASLCNEDDDVYPQVCRGNEMRTCSNGGEEARAATGSPTGKGWPCLALGSRGIYFSVVKTET